MSTGEKLIAEQALIKGCLAGSRKAQQELYDRYSGVLFGMCLRYSRTEADACDILQEGFTRIFVNLEQFKFGGSFEGWMKRVVVNCAMAWYRKKNTVQYVEQIFETNDSTIERVNAIDELSNQELRAMISALPDGYRTVFNMYAIEGYSHKEIAKELGISVGTSKSQLSDARKLLRKTIHANSLVATAVKTM